FSAGAFFFCRWKRQGLVCHALRLCEGRGTLIRGWAFPPTEKTVPRRLRRRTPRGWPLRELSGKPEARRRGLAPREADDDHGVHLRGVPGAERGPDGVGRADAAQERPGVPRGRPDRQREAGGLAEPPAPGGLLPGERRLRLAGPEVRGQGGGPARR